MSKYILLSIFVAACSGTGSSAVITEQPTAPSGAVSAVLQGAGGCVGPTCTMHFAAATSGDAVSFSSARCGDGSCPVRKARLTDAGRAKAREIGALLANIKLDENYGCPGCADGPTYVAVVHRADGSQSSHTFDPLASEDLPLAMRDASKLIESVSSALHRCESTDLAHVELDCAQLKAQDDGHPTGRP